MAEQKQHPILIYLPKNIADELKVIAESDGRKTKPYIERLVIAHVERKNKTTAK